jgi:uncharacterized protein (DUF1697 family)
VTRYVGLLRAVNLGPTNRVGMADLRELLEGLGMKEVRSLLQSGNLVFHGSARSTSQLENLLQRETARRLGLETQYFVRTAGEWKDLLADNPFPVEAKRDPGHLLVVFLKEAPARAVVTSLQKAIAGREVVRAKGRQAYVVYPDGIGRSRLTSALIERKLGTRGTGRNWNTVLKLGTLADV